MMRPRRPKQSAVSYIYIYIYIYIYVYICIYIKSTKNIVKATLSRLLSSEFEESFTKPFIR